MQTNLLGTPVPVNTNSLNKKVDVQLNTGTIRRVGTSRRPDVFMQIDWRSGPSLKHLVVARLPHSGHHVDEKSAEDTHITQHIPIALGFELLGKQMGEAI